MSSSSAESKDQSLTDYLNKIGKISLLTPVEEIELGCSVQKMIILLDSERNDFTPDEKKDIKNGERAKKRMVESNLRLVVSVARKYAKSASHMKILDLIQEGNIGLIRAVEKFDPVRGYRFTTYAYWWIRQAITRGLENYEKDIKIPSQITKLVIKIKALNELHFEKYGRLPTKKEILRIINKEEARNQTSINSIELAMSHFNRTVSLDSAFPHPENPSPDSSFSSSLHSIVSEGEIVANEIDEEEADRKEKIAKVRSALEMLTDTERLLLSLKYGLNGEAPMTAKEISIKQKIPIDKARGMINDSDKKLKAIIFQFF